MKLPSHSFASLAREKTSKNNLSNDTENNPLRTQTDKRASVTRSYINRQSTAKESSKTSPKSDRKIFSLFQESDENEIIDSDSLKNQKAYAIHLLRTFRTRKHSLKRFVPNRLRHQSNTSRNLGDHRKKPKKEFDNHAIRLYL